MTEVIEKIISGGYDSLSIEERLKIIEKKQDEIIDRLDALREKPRRKLIEK